MIENKITVFGDDCHHHGIGYWAASIKMDGETKVIAGVNHYSTSPRMLLTATLEAMDLIPKGEPVTIYSDAKYLTENAELYLHKWIRNGWKKADGTYVRHMDLWARLALIMAEHPVTFVHVAKNDEDITNLKEMSKAQYEQFKLNLKEDMEACLN